VGWYVGGKNKKEMCRVLNIMVVSLYHNQNKFIMLYFLTEDENGIIEPKIYEPERDISYKWQQTLGKKLHGIFGRLDMRLGGVIFTTD